MKAGNARALHITAIFVACLVVATTLADPVSRLFLQKSSTRWIALVPLALYLLTFLPAQGFGKPVHRVWSLPLLASLFILIAVTTPLLNGYWTRHVIAAHERRPGSFFELDRPEDFFSPQYGPLLVQSTPALQRTYFTRVERAKPGDDIVTDRGQYAFLWLALRAQGRTDDEIFEAHDPDGRRLFLGTLLAEISPTQDLPTWILDPQHPAILPPQFARKCFDQLLRQLLDNPSRWAAPLLIIAMERPEFADPRKLDTLLETWEQVRQRDLKQPSIAPALAARKAIIDSLHGRTRVNPRFPKQWGETARENAWRELDRFLQTAGIKLQRDPAGILLTLRCDLPLYQNLPTQELQRTIGHENYTVYRTRQVAPPIQWRLRPANYPRADTTPHLEYEQIQKQTEVYNDTLISKCQDVKVPTLFLSLPGTPEIAIPPVTIIPLTAIHSYQSEDPGRMTPEHRRYFEDAFTSFLSEALHFGLSYYSLTSAG